MLEGESLSHVQVFVTPWTIQSWNSPGQNTRVGSLSLLQGILPTQESNRGLLPFRQILYQLSYQGSLYMYTYIYTLLICLLSYLPGLEFIRQTESRHAQIHPKQRGNQASVFTEIIEAMGNC